MEMTKIGTAPASEEDAEIIHNYHRAEWRPWSRGPQAADVALRQMERVARNQRDREARLLGYADLGESGA